MSDGYVKTACILCSVNCGIEVKLEDGHIRHVRGDRAHPNSAGYLCQKAQQLDHYQNHSLRLDTPLRRRSDGGFEPVSWETAISEIAAALGDIRTRHGSQSLAYYGGGGQGNHVGGVYGTALRAALGTRNYYNALSQEKTGEFWVNGRLFGSENAHVTEDFEHCDVAVFLGCNPWQAHGVQRARVVLKEIQANPNRKMIVVDPRRTETAAMADLHLRVRPGGDAWLLAALNAQIVRDGNVKREWLQSHTHGIEDVLAALAEIDVDACAERAGVDVGDVRTAARWIGEARSCAIREDLGLQQTLHSTLNSYLDKLLWLLTGNFAKPGGNNLHTTFFLAAKAFAGESRGPERNNSYVSPVLGHRVIQNLLPPNILPLEILADHPERCRAVFVDSANPVLTGADTLRYREAFSQLDLLVVVDVALTETARLAHYVLPAASQFEKWEATMFSFEFPSNAVHFRPPVFEARTGTLDEPEIYTRLLEEMRILPREFPELTAAAEAGREDYYQALIGYLGAHRSMAPFLVPIVYRTLGPTLPGRSPALAFAWLCSHGVARKYPDAVRRARHTGATPFALGEAVFEAVAAGHSGVVFTQSEYDETWRDLIRHPDGKIALAIPELLSELRDLADEPLQAHTDEFPFVLSAGERRAYNANQVYRDPDWRKQDRNGALRIHPADAGRLGLATGDPALCRSRRGAVAVEILLDETVQRGVVSLPHGFGMLYTNAQGVLEQNGPAVNVLTDSEDRDPIAGTPWHKHVRVNIESVSSLH
jgi:anaerobic selenocysteine-containing dehydrogenase